MSFFPLLFFVVGLFFFPLFLLSISFSLSLSLHLSPINESTGTSNQLTKLPERSQQQVGPLLVVQPPDPPHQRHRGVDPQPQLLLQRGLAFRFPAQVRRRVVGRQRRVPRRVPLADVDPVGHAVEHVRPLPQHVVEAPPALGRLHLPRVPARHGHDAVRRLDPGLEDVGVLAADGVVEVERGAALAGGHRKQVCVRGRAAALVRRVVQHEHGARVLVLPVVPVVRLQHHGQQGGVPVVGDEDEVVLAKDGAAAGDGARGLERGLGEERAPEGDV